LKQLPASTPNEFVPNAEAALNMQSVSKASSYKAAGGSESGSVQIGVSGSTEESSTSSLMGEVSKSSCKKPWQKLKWADVIDSDTDDDDSTDASTAPSITSSITCETSFSSLGKKLSQKQSADLVDSGKDYDSTSASTTSSVVGGACFSILGGKRWSEECCSDDED
jgi:hypothetical protein